MKVTQEQYLYYPHMDFVRILCLDSFGSFDEIFSIFYKLFIEREKIFHDNEAKTSKQSRAKSTIDAQQNN